MGIFFFCYVLAQLQASESSDSEVGSLMGSSPVHSYLMESDSDEIDRGLYHIRRQDLPLEQNLRILNVCGGGTRGILSATILSELEKKIGNGFDSSQIEGFGGTSTGGLVAIAKAIGISTQSIQDLYFNHANQIFL